MKPTDNKPRIICESIAIGNSEIKHSGLEIIADEPTRENPLELEMLLRGAPDGTGEMIIKITFEWQKNNRWAVTAIIPFVAKVKITNQLFLKQFPPIDDIVSVVQQSLSMFRKDITELSNGKLIVPAYSSDFLKKKYLLDFGSLFN